MASMDVLKAIVVTVGLIVLVPLAGGIVGFGVGYVVAAMGRFGPHDAELLMALFVIGGACLGLVAGAVAIYRFVTKPQSN